jgi:nucleotide-binding universal stress UspA family protein
MNALRQILALVNDGPRSDTVLALAARLAQRHGAAVDALHAVQPATSGAYLSPEAAALAIELVQRADEARAEAAASRVAAAAARSGLAIPLHPAAGDPALTAAAHAQCADLVVLAQRPLEGDDGTDAGFAGRLLVRAGAPLLFVPAVDTLTPEADGAPPCGRHVLVAWAPRRESARALRDALPLLAAAERVEVVRLADPDEDTDAPEPLDAVCAHLQRHGVSAHGRRLVRATASRGGGLIPDWNPDVPVAEALLSHAADSGADLLVMGGFGHTRAWELVLGGVTRTMLRSMTLPVLMSH